MPGQRLTFVDHLIPLCELMEIPVLVTHPIVKEQIELYYPPVEVILAESEECVLDEALERYDLFFYVHFSRTGNQTFLFNEYFCSKKVRSVMSLHGNPDKFHDIYWIENLAAEDVLLAYGPQLVELIKSKGIDKKPIICGNYRLEYYKKHEAFFDRTLPFQKEKTTILYAPTWASPNQSLAYRKYYTGFLDSHRDVFENIPDDFQLVCKLHSFLYAHLSDQIYQIKEEYPHILFLDDYPVIYPLLKQIDVYLGDYSSLGYDFLYFDRPLFFLNTHVETPLQSCGVRIQEGVYETIRNNLGPNPKRKEVYAHAFGEPKPLEQLKKEIQQCVLT